VDSNLSSIINKLNQNTKIESKTGGIESKVTKIKKLIQQIGGKFPYGNKYLSEFHVLYLFGELWIFYIKITARKIQTL
jgi:hypothetical protein